MKLRVALIIAVLAAALVVLLATPAGAAPALGNVTVSDPRPVRDTVIEVSSTGWKPRSVVAITMSGITGAIARGTANANGAVHVQVAIPDHAPLGFDVLAVSGLASAGVPQEIVTGLTVIRAPDTGRRVRPWTAVYSLAFLATLLLLFSQKLMNRDRALVVADG